MLERLGSLGAPVTRRRPQVIGGICEFCGVMDNNQLSVDQYKLCSHFKDVGELRCSYCPESVDPIEVIRKAKINTYENPDRPGVWIAVCDSYNCVTAHQKRFNRATS